MRRKQSAKSVQRGNVIRFNDGKFHRVTGVINTTGIVHVYGREDGKGVPRDHMSINEDMLIERRRNV